MATTVRRTRFNSSTLIRLLSNLEVGGLNNTGAHPESDQTFVQSLGLWLDWTQAIALAEALGSPTEGGGRPEGAQTARPLASLSRTEVRHVREALSQAIRCDAAWADTPRPGAFTADAPTAGVVADLAAVKRACQAHQRAMESALAPLRATLRRRLAAGTPMQAQLAALDGVMECALATRERQLLSRLPQLMEQRFERQRDVLCALQGAAAAPAFPAYAPAGAVQSGSNSAPQSAPQSPEQTACQAVWWAACCGETQAVLLAELDLRMQPLEGLLEALEGAAA